MEEKTCFNCGHFERCYIIHRGVLVPVGNGYCRCSHVHWKMRQKAPVVSDCPHWTDDEEAKAARREQLKRELDDTRTRLEEIALILKEDKI